MAEARTDEGYERENIRFHFEDEMFLARQRYPHSLDESLRIVDEIAELAAAGKHIALVDGSFDVPQPNHQWYLQHCRLLAGRNYYRQHGVVETDPAKLAGCDEVVLVVTLDTDARIAGIKGGAIEGVVKPIYPWGLRAQYISNFMTPVGNDLYRPVVDIVTIEGSEAEAGTPHESQLALGAALLEKGALHTWVFYGEHGEKRTQADELIAVSGAENAETVGIMDHIDYCVDEAGNPWKSTAIIKKIRGE